MEIRRATEVDDDLVAAFEYLIPQLSPEGTPPSREELAQIITSPDTELYIVINDQNKIVGTMTLAFYRTPTALHAWIEDVVVDENTRGNGIGAELTQLGILRSKERGAKCVNLTSRPAREAANHLYQRIGFQRWLTNAYRYPLQQEG